MVCSSNEIDQQHWTGAGSIPVVRGPREQQRGFSTDASAIPTVGMIHPRGQPPTALSGVSSRLIHTSGWRLTEGVRRLPSQAKGARLRAWSRRSSRVQISPSAPLVFIIIHGGGGIRLGRQVIAGRSDPEREGVSEAWLSRSRGCGCLDFRMEGDCVRLWESPGVCSRNPISEMECVPGDLRSA